MNELNTPASLQRGHHRAPAPGGQFLFDALAKPLHPRARLLYRLHVLFKGQPLRRLRQLQLRNPASMRGGPSRLARVTHVVTQQQRRQALSRLALHHHCIFARAYQIAHRFIAHVRHIDRRELAAARPTRELQAIAPVGLDPIAHPPRRVRWRHYPTGMTPRGQAAIDAKPARPRLVDEHQLPARRLELTHRSPQRIHIAADLTMMANLAAFLRHREIDRFLVHIHTDVQLARLLTHGLPPVFRLTPSRLNVWLCVVRHAIHDTEEAGRLLLTGSHYV